MTRRRRAADRRAGLLAVLLLALTATAAAQTEIYGSGCSGASAPTISVAGSILPGSKAQVSLAGAPPGAFVYFLLGKSDTTSGFGPLPFDLSGFAGFQPGCKLLTSVETQLLINASPLGTLKFSFKLPANMGSDLYAQWAVVESISPLSVVMTAGAHICLQTNPDVHAEIVGPSAVVDWDGNGTQAVPLSGAGSHTHEAGHAITSWKWKLDGQPAGTTPSIAPVVPLGAHVATLTVGDDSVPADTALASHAFSVSAPTSAPGVLARYYGSGAADPANLLDAEPVAADWSEVLAEAIVPDNGGFVGGSPFTGQCMVTLDCKLTLPTTGEYTFSAEGGSETRLFVDGVLTSGPKQLVAGVHSVEARYAVPGAAALPLAILLAQGTGSPQPLDSSNLTYDATAAGPVIDGLTPPDGPTAGGTLVTISGLGFFPPASTQVIWGDLVLGLADGLQIEPTQITLTTPAHASGPQLVRVVTPAGASNASSFTYVTGGPSVVDFVLATSVPLPQPTSAEWGQDGRLYVATLGGEIRALSFDADWNLVSMTSYVGVSQLPNFNVLGLTVNPFDPPGSVRLYVSHGLHYADGGGLVTAPSAYLGQVSILSGPSFDSPQPLLTGLPQPNTGHAVNGMQFDDNGDLLLACGSDTNAGCAWPTMGALPESPLSASILKALTSKQPFKGNVSYVFTSSGLPSTDQRFGETSLLAPGSDVTVQGHGLRNPYDLVYTTGKKLYATDNGPNAGYGPASTGPHSNSGTHPDEPDELLLVEAGIYYGSPNRSRGQFDTRQTVYHGPWEASQPDVFRQALVTLPSSQDGILEYHSEAFGGAMRGDLVVQKYNGDARRITLATDGRSVTTVQNIGPVTGALDIVEGPGGALIAVDFSGSEIEVLVPVESAPATLTVTDIRPWRAPAAGGTPFVIGGRGFAGTVASSSVKIGNLQAVLTSVSPTRITGFLPPQPAPTTDFLDLTVTSGNQTDVLPEAFRYLLPAGNEPGVWELGGGNSSGGGELPFALTDATAAALGGKLFVAGAESPSLFVLDLMGSTQPPLAFASTAPRPFPGSGSSAESINGKLYLVGGAGPSAGKLQVYDPVSNQWSLGPNLPWLGNSVCTAVINGKLYAAGGIVGATTVDNMAVFDPAINQWAPLPPMPFHTGRNHASAGTDGQRLWIFGGYGFGNGDSGQFAPAFDTVQSWDPQTGAWKSSSAGMLPPLPVPRAGAGRALFWQGRFYIFGGESTLLPGGVTPRVDAFDPVEQAWHADAPLPTPRHGQAIAIFEGRIFVVGGNTGGGTVVGGSKAVEVFNRQ